MNIKKVILGEKMPDKEDPKYKERYERDVEAGRKAARFLKLDKAAFHLQKWAQKHSGLFFFLVLLFVVATFFLNIYRIATATRTPRPTVTAVQKQEEKLRKNGIDNRHTIESYKGLEESVSNRMNEPNK